MDWILERAADFECFLSVVGGQNGVPFFGEHQPDQIPNDGIVFGEQYDGLFRFHKRSRGLYALRALNFRALLTRNPVWRCKLLHWYR